MLITRAIPRDHEALTKLTKASKAYWGFEPMVLEQWSDELTITSEYIAENFVYKLLSEEQLIGYYSYFEEGPKMVKLDNLFIEPEFIRQGYGTLLMDDFLQRVSEQYVKVKLDSEPNAVQFYANYGFEVIGQLPSKIEGRFLPIMVKVLGNGE